MTQSGAELKVAEELEDEKLAVGLRGMDVPELMGKLVEFTETIKTTRGMEADATAARSAVLIELAERGYHMTVSELQPVVVSQGVQSAPIQVTIEGEIPVEGQVIGQPIVPELPEEKVPAGRSEINDDEMSEEDWAREIEQRVVNPQDTRNAESIRRESRVPADEAAQNQEVDATGMANGLNQAIAAGLFKADRFRKNAGSEGYRVG